MILMPGGEIHPHLGRFHGTDLLKILKYCASCFNKVGNMRLYRSHFVECGGIRDAEDQGTFNLHHLEDSNMVIRYN